MKKEKKWSGKKMKKVLDFTKDFVLKFLELEKSGDVKYMQHTTMHLYGIDVCSKLEELGYVLQEDGDKDIFVKENKPTFLGLTEEQFYQFLLVHNMHIRCWGEDSLIEQHSIINIEKVYWVEEERCFHVHYKETEQHRKVWYPYDTNKGTWW
ncbi:hypothetical protein [Neobacillus sp. PS3-40]|uniref:hypothetical protein n=1 Tax=Neobacillus sp. PS3-40 TaxID=3070679 RepID=UPI0027DF6EE3|nr:hypothetical protein [Neobacillus sp. PS3-40]WML43114.1 hypothetical protein RCG20_15065 [Neobacillus sp. PS3-40]